MSTIDLTPTKSFTTKRSFTYHYIHHPIPNTQKPTALLLTGFPEDPTAVKFLSTYLHTKLNLPILIPYNLGYYPTSRPTDPKCYASAGMIQDLVEILHHENIKEIYSFGRDWGSFLASRFAVFAPEMTKALVMMAFLPSAPHLIPRGSLEDAERWMRMYRDNTDVKYPNFDYMYYYEAEDSAPDHDRDQNHTFNVFMAWEESRCQAGIFRQMFNGRWIVRPLNLPGVEELKTSWVERMGRNGWTGPLNWYKAFIRGHHYESEKEFADGKWSTDIPSLFIAGDKDMPCPPMKDGHVEPGYNDLEHKVVKGAGHGLEWAGGLNDNGAMLINAVGEWLLRKKLV